MSKPIAYFQFGRVYPPLVAGAPPVAPESDAAPEPEYTHLHVFPFVALLWYVIHIAIIGAVIVTLLVDAEGYCTSPLQPIAAIPTALALWLVTLFVRWLARRETA